MGNSLRAAIEKNVCLLQIRHLRYRLVLLLIKAQWLYYSLRLNWRISVLRVSVLLLLQIVTKEIGCAIEQLPASDRPRTSAEKVTLLSLWMLANMETFRQVSDRFDTGTAQAYRWFAFFVKMFSGKLGEYIVWPPRSRFASVLSKFDDLRERSFPDAFGAVDGCHIAIKCPTVDSASYYNRKGFHSLLLQGICDAEQRFMDVYVGWPGSTHDARVWKNSPIYDRLKSSAHQLLPSNGNILGDSAYPCDTFLMCPYRDNGHLTTRQKNFNAVLSATRVVIEQAFGLLKGRFRRLKFLDMLDLKLASKVVATACVLHNLCINNNDETEPDTDIAAGNADGDQDAEETVTVNVGFVKRDNIAAALQRQS